MQQPTPNRGPSWPVIALVTGLSLVLLTALTLGIVSLAKSGNVSTLAVGASQQTGIAVCGQGTAFVQPDQAQVTAGVQATAPSAQAARSQAARAMNAVLAALTNAGVANQDIQTSYFAIEPTYSYGSGGPQPTGYSATNTVQVTIHQVNAVGTIVDAVTQAGGNNVVVQGIAFTSSNPTQGKTQAEQNALADAHRQAQQIAQGSGITLGAPISIQVGSCGNTPIPPSFAQAASAGNGDTSTPIQAGQQQISVIVDVVYAMR
ncbi:MAG: SIMPL domain-containing protein [Ktedonobacterales bacterium]